ncbi:MAG: DUF4230 domain-containing protein [Labilithrix sp.]|nr:DUF4230 domain-containing protein [Labilithrix sp.]
MRLAWPAAFVAVAAMGFGWLRAEPPKAEAHVVEVVPTGPTVVRELRAVARLETASMHVEKVIDLKDHQKRFRGLVDAEDSLLFVASGEVVLGVDLGRLGPDDVGFDEATKTATIELPAPEVFSTRFDEAHSYVHSRRTDTFAVRNEGLEAAARREAAAAFAKAGREPRAIDLAKEHAATQLRALAKAWGAKDLIVRWRAPAGELAAQ